MGMEFDENHFMGEVWPPEMKIFHSVSSMAQLVARKAVNLQVIGSNPIRGVIFLYHLQRINGNCQHVTASNRI
jgi:hypothetical protein